MTTLEQVNMLINTAAYCVIAGTGLWAAYGNLKKSDSTTYDVIVVILKKIWRKSLLSKVKHDQTREDWRAHPAGLVPVLAALFRLARAGDA